MNKLVISLPTIDDVETIMKWGEENQELWSSERGEWYTQESLIEWITKPTNDILLGAYHNKKLIGICIIHTLHGNWSYCSVLFVDTLFRGQGVGTKLLETAKQKLKNKKIYSMGLLTVLDNKPAIQFYKKRGLLSGFEMQWFDMKIK